MNESRRKTHALVGDGITALAFLEALTLNQGDELVLIGSETAEFGRGVAYAKGAADEPWRYAYLLNSPADDIDPNFARWLSQNWEDLQARMIGRQPDWLAAAKPLLETGDTYGLNAPREFYGDYMREIAEAKLAKLCAAGVSIVRRSARALSVETAGDHLKVVTNDGTEILVDTLDIAPGGPSTQRIPGDDGPFSAPTLFGEETRIAKHVGAGAEVFCIGANATMLDALRLCQSVLPEDELRFIACSPRGELPPPLIPRTPRRLTVPDLKPGHATARSFLNDVQREIEAARLRGEEMREIRAGFRAHFLAVGLARYVPDMDEARQVPATLRHWLRGGTRDTILDFHRLTKLGKTRSHTGAVSEIEHHSNGANVILRDRVGNVSAYRTDFVINCSGAGETSTFDPLTEDLLEKQWIAKCPITGGLEVGRDCRTREPRIRHLSPATTVIGKEVMPMPLYDAHLLRSWAQQSIKFEPEQ